MYCDDNEEWVNNLNRTAILNTKQKMQNDPDVGADRQISFDAIWKEGVVTEPSGHLVCYPPPEMQLNELKQGPSIYTYCPLISGGCFALVLMMRAAEKDYHFQTMGTTMKTDADFMGFYKNKWVENMDGWHPWVDGIKVEMLVQTDKTQKELDELAEYSEKHCPSNEIMRREFPVNIHRFEKSKVVNEKSINWEKVPCYYNMEKYNEIANGDKDKYIIQQQANMFWHCQNESTTHPDSLMTFEFPNDSNSKLALSYDQPIGSGKYASPVAGCFFGGLSSFLHTIAARVYAHGYKVEEIKGSINSQMNMRKIFGLDDLGYIFPFGASIGIDIVTNAPRTILDEILFEAENMSPTMMNWRHELPLQFEIHREKVTMHKRASGASSVASDTDIVSPQTTRKKSLFAFMKSVLGRKVAHKGGAVGSA